MRGRLSGLAVAAGVLLASGACRPTPSPKPTYLIGGTVSGLPASTSVVLRINGGDDLTVPVNGPFAFAIRLPDGASYSVTVQTAPAGLTCTVGGGTGAVAGANVSSIAVTCMGVVVQSWQAPTSWGGPWPDGPTMVQHAHFGAAGIVNDKGPAFAFVGGAEPAPFQLDGIGAPERTIHGGGPFPVETVNYRAPEAAGLDLPGDMLVCAVIKPDFDPIDPHHEAPIFAKGVGDATLDLPGGGWVLMQMADSFCFHYEYLDGDGNTHMAMAFTPTYFADQDRLGHGTNPVGAGIRKASPVNPSFLVVCAGRSGDRLAIAVNSYPDAHFNSDLSALPTPQAPFPGPYTLDAGTAFPATIGGHAVPSSALGLLNPAVPLTAEHVFGGRIYETAVWSEPATEANIRAKFAVIQGLPSGGTYTRNREAPFLDGNGRYHTTYRDGPRIDASRGFLFGLQGWNRVSYWQYGDLAFPDPMVYAAGEDLTLWTGNGGATVVRDPLVSPPGDATTATSRVSLPAGASISLLLDNVLANPNPPPVPTVPRPPSWDSSGPIQGQIWLRRAAATTGTLRVRKTRPAPSAPTADHQDIDLAGLSPDTWTRVALTDLTADGTWPFDASVPDAGTLFLENVGATAISFSAWGLDLTQIGGGGSNYDPGPIMYDWGSSNDVISSGGSLRNLDVLQLPTVPASTAGTGFCLSVDAQMPAGLPWSAPFHWARTALTWASHAVDGDGKPAALVQLYVDGTNFGATAGQLCLTMSDVTAPVTCGPVPAAWNTDGLSHTVKACVSAAGQVRLYDGDSGTQIGATATIPAGSVPDLGGGRLLIGNAEARRVWAAMPWHGYVSRVAACRDTGDLAGCR